MTGPFGVEELVARYAVADRSLPHLRVNFVTSLDGAATHDGLSGGLNNPADQQVFHTLRMLADVVLVGAGTVRVEGYEDLRLTAEQQQWRIDRGLSEHPVMAVVSARLDLDPALPIFARAPVRPLVFTTASAPTQERHALQLVADVVTAGDERVDPRLVVGELTERGLPQILSEGGPRWFGTMIGAGVVDELCLTLSPLLEGGDAGRIARHDPQLTQAMRLASVLRDGDMLILRYLRTARPRLGEW